jgi:Tol biopolymer transport system component
MSDSRTPPGVRAGMPLTPDMTPERWRSVDAILQAALGRDPGERPAFVAEACGADAALRREVDSLLAATPAEDFLERAPAGLADTGAHLAAALAGRFAVERELGHGGMATVYLAPDLQQRRPVALKVLHRELGALLGADRFLREIALTASLQHPHVLPLFESGEAAGLLYYVMPFVAGESLRVRLARERQLPVGEAVRIAVEVAAALEYAHRHGVVHRDVKPENLLLAEDGSALVADFGIALAVSNAGGERLTQPGVSLGTPQYMAPEQALGQRAVDARADVYALGAVLYEMLVGEPPFTGPTAHAVVTKVLHERPAPPSRARDTVPPHVEAAALRALAKLPADRFASAAAFAAALTEPTAAVGAAPSGAIAPPAARALHLSPRAAAAAALGTLAAVAVAWAAGRASSRAATAPVSPERGPVRFTIDVDSGSLGTGGPAIAPDGRTVVYAVEGPDGSRLYARRVDELVARPLAGTEDGAQPFFSPDGAWVAFYSRGALRKVRLDGGAAVVVAEVPPPAWFSGGSWGPGDTIYYAVPSHKALYRVPAAGGAATRVAVADTSMFMYDPHVLPGGQAVLLTTVEWTSAGRITVLDLASGRLRRFGLGSAPRYAGGHIIYASVGADGALYRQPFDVERRAPTGDPEQIASGLAYLMDGVPFDVSPGGALVYRVGGSAASPDYFKLALTDSAGRELRRIEARLPWSPRFSPDGRRVVYGALAPGRDAQDLWITDLGAGTQRLTTDGNNNNDAQWSPDGKRIAYSADAPLGTDVFVQALDGSPPRALTRRAGFQFPSDWLRDGSAVLFIDVPITGAQAGNQDIWVQPMDGSAARPYVATPAHERGARASPDGRWVAYHSDETGRDEVYVQSYPTPGRKTLVSAAGGVHPAWRGDSRMLYYWQGEQLVAARVEPGGAGEPLVVRDRTPLFRAPYPGGVIAMYDVSPDGRRFILAVGHERANRLVVALDALAAADARGSGPPR